jgi:hypothetical protein
MKLKDKGSRIIGTSGIGPHGRYQVAHRPQRLMRFPT